MTAATAARSPGYARTRAKFRALYTVEADTAPADDLIAFARATFPRYTPAPHHRLIADALMAVERGEIDRLIITMPPRHGKSELASVRFPAWYLGRNPDKRIIATSYGAGLAYRMSRQARNIVGGPGWPFPVRLADDLAQVQQWDIAGHRGGYIAAGSGGPITGSGAHCFPAGTRILTDHGAIAIEHLSRLQYHYKVLAFDHANGQSVWRRVEATRERWSDDLYEVTTTGGRTFRATGNHPIYIAESGYRATALLRPGDRLVALSQQQDVRSVRSTQDRAGRDVPGVLSAGASGYGRAALRLVRQGIHATALRIREVATQGRAIAVLLARLLIGAQRGQECPALRYLRQAYAGQVAQQVLLAGMSGGGADTHAERLQVVRADIQRRFDSASVLRPGVCERGTLGAHDWGGQLPLQDRDQLREMVRGYAPADFRAGSASLRGVPETGSHEPDTLARADDYADQYGGSPHQRIADRQYSGQSHHALQDVSRDTPQVEYDTVAVVRRLRCGSVPVYDIQVAGCHNFFAEEILAHNCLLIDDPIRNQQDADSATLRDHLWEWYTSTAYTRLEDGGAVILILTRWHADDLAGRLLAAQAAGGDRWHVLHLPAIAEDGSALWPEKYDRPALERIKTAVGSRVFAALYQGQPSNDETALLKREWWKFYGGPTGVALPTRFDQSLQSWDMTFKGGVHNDFVAGQIWERAGADCYLTDRVKARLDFPGTLTAMRAMRQRRPDVLTILVEDTANGPAVIATLQHELPGLIAVRPEGGKVARVNAMAGLVEAGNVWLPHPNIAPWVAEFIEEATAFPTGAHDDEVDAMSQGVNRLAQPAEQSYQFNYRR